MGSVEDLRMIEQGRKRLTAYAAVRISANLRSHFFL
jgi:hypothetical protein